MKQKKGLILAVAAILIAVLAGISISENTTSKKLYEQRDELGILPMAQNCGLNEDVLDGDDGWYLYKEKDGIKVYRRVTPITPVKSFKAVAEVEGDLKRVAALFWDGERYVNWLHLCDEARMVEVLSETETIMYTMNNTPWPLSERDNVNHRKIYQDPETLAVTIEVCNMPDYLPEQKGRVRMPILVGYERIIPKGNGKLEIIYEVLTDPGGWIPNWMVNMLGWDAPYRTLMTLRKMLPLDEYKDVKLDFIKTPGISNPAENTSQNDKQLTLMNP
jgi:hypothetical protein